MQPQFEFSNLHRRQFFARGEALLEAAALSSLWASVEFGSC